MEEKRSSGSSAPVVARKYVGPFILLTSLFALWGFANDITNPMVSAFKKVMELDNVQASLVQLAFYGGYFTMALPAALVVNRYSYKAGIVVGLALFAIGAFLFYPAASLQMYGLFLTGLYVLTFGLAFLETTANPYILAMGAEQTATQRLNLAQAFNPMGALGGLLVAQQFILGSLLSDDVDAAGNSVFATLDEAGRATMRAHDLQVIRDPYVMLGLVVLGVLVIMVVAKMPTTHQGSHRVNAWQSIRRLFRVPRFVGGVGAQAFYVGAQIMCWTYVYQYAEALGIPNQQAVYYAIAAMAVFLVGRWIGTALLRFMTSGKLLVAFATGAALCAVGTIWLEGMPGLYALVGISLFMSVMFPTIYGMALEGLGEDAKFGAAFLVMAIVGGALMPTLQGLILDLGGRGYTDVRILGTSEVKFSFVLPLLCFVVVGLYGALSRPRSG